jgi:hypothetical protein
VSYSDEVQIKKSLVQIKITNDKYEQTGKKTGMSYRTVILQHNPLETEVTRQTSVRSGYSQLKFKRRPVECEKYTLKF